MKMIRRRLLKLIACAAVVAALLTGLVPRARSWLAVDACLEQGGRWVSGACEDDGGQAMPMYRDSSTLWPERRVVLGAAAVGPMRDGCWDAALRARVSGTWAPTVEQVSMADSLLGERLVSPDARKELRSTPLARYYRQFIGIQLGGNKVIYINGFAHPFDPSGRGVDVDTAEWRRVVFCVHGGGAHYFTAIVDPQARALRSLNFNPAM